VKRIIARFSYGGTAAVPSQNWGRDSARPSKRMTECAASMRGGALVDSAVFRHLMIFHQAEAPIDQGLFVFVG